MARLKNLLLSQHSTSKSTLQQWESSSADTLETATAAVLGCHGAGSNCDPPIVATEHRCRNGWPVDIACAHNTSREMAVQDDDSSTASTISSSNDSTSTPTHIHATLVGSISASTATALPPTLKKHRGRVSPIQDDHDAWRIRSRYLHSLGILISEHRQQERPNPTGCCGSIVSVSGVARPTALLIRPSPSATALLKDDYGKVDNVLLQEIKKREIIVEESSPDHILQSISLVHPIKGTIKKFGGNKKACPLTRITNIPHPTADAAAAAPSTGRITFHPAIQVREIPSHRQYSERIKKTIWMLPQKFMECIIKNSIEFMAEGLEPDRVVDESAFVERNGKLVHPVCQLLEEPENIVMKGVYYGIKPAALLIR